MCVCVWLRSCCLVLMRVATGVAHLLTTTVHLRREWLTATVCWRGGRGGRGGDSIIKQRQQSHVVDVCVCVGVALNASLELFVQRSEFHSQQCYTHSPGFEFPGINCARNRSGRQFPCADTQNRSEYIGYHHSRSPCMCGQRSRIYYQQNTHTHTI